MVTLVLSISASMKSLQTLRTEDTENVISGRRECGVLFECKSGTWRSVLRSKSHIVCIYILIPYSCVEYTELLRDRVLDGPDVVLNEHIDDGVGKVLPSHQEECDNDVVESLIVV